MREAEELTAVWDALREAGVDPTDLSRFVNRPQTPAEHDTVVDLASDKATGTERQMLVYALWRVKSDRARALILELLDDPAVAKHAIHSLSRAFGNDEARRRLEPLRDHPDEHVRAAAREALRRIAKPRR